MAVLNLRDPQELTRFGHSTVQSIRAQREQLEKTLADPAADNPTVLFVLSQIMASQENIAVMLMAIHFREAERRGVEVAIQRPPIVLPFGKKQ